MPNCPNCGRRAMRTKDWVCQWCGYPLLSGGFKQLDKTYKELQEEKDSAWKSVKPEPEPEFNFEHGPEPEIEPEPAAHSTGPSYRLEPEDEPEIEEPPEPEPAPEPEKQPEPPQMEQPPPEPGPPRAEEPMITPPPEIAPQPQPEQLPPSESEPEPMITPPPPVVETEPMITPPPQPPPQPPTPPEQETPPETELAPEPEREPVVAPHPEPPAPPHREAPPEPAPLPSLNSIQQGPELTIDQIDTLFRVDSVGASNAFKDKTLLVRGMVNKVFIRDHLDIRYLILTGTGKQMWSARCTFGKESSPQMSRLSEGQSILLQGKYDGFSKNIIFKDCVLVGR